MIRVLTIVGARPQFIKASAVSRAMLQYPNLHESILHTGQHFDEKMSDVFFEEMRIPKPRHRLEIQGRTHGAMTAEILVGIEKVLLRDRPDFVLVYGDTNSTLAGALAAVKLHIPVVHVEAGLRSHNMKMPEEVNRLLVDRISNLLLCPTQQSVHNLREEGYFKNACTVELVGDVMQDVANFYRELATPCREAGPFALATIHRADNTDDLTKLRGILKGFSQLPLSVVLPLHPRTRKVIDQNAIDVPPNVRILEPVSYLEMVGLLRACELVLTDSGGLQKESYFFKKHCIVLREETEWTELVEAGYNRLAGTDSEKIARFATEAKERSSGFLEGFYGGGRASQKVCESILRAAEKFVS